jgi:hypothetical protein
MYAGVDARVVTVDDDEPCNQVHRDLETPPGPNSMRAVPET